eukprot:TRINITY_DN7228_c0_g1_i1.p1 TRINITY_DN7228_c0_g1~~TRINITY_DN7228_c0_g1_i1.p1  ORF type:complete len:405 (+),score=46.00 TRINITY_DN7228_c0_g1_i1:178-1215(+)
MIQENKVHYVMNEKSILLKLKHPNIIRLISTFQTQDELFFVLEYAEKGELLEYIKKMGCFEVSVISKITAELVNALSYLHSQKIIHRDVKPENVLFDHRYHVKLIDFGTATISTAEPEPLERKKHEPDPDDEFKGRQRDEKGSFCGTAQYASPELLLNCSTTYSSDLWALGCIVFQMATGTRPFQDPSDYLTFRRILDRDIRYPPEFPSVVKDLCEKLLVLDPTQRVGVGAGGYNALRCHPLFAGINFQSLASEELGYSWCAKAPKWIPDSQVDQCFECKNAFTFFNRKHHCRACGNIFCQTCSQRSIEIPNMDHRTPVRVCGNCYLLVKKRNEEEKQSRAKTES